MFAFSSLLILVYQCFFYFRYDALCILLRHSKNVRYWFAQNVLFAYPNRFSEYLLECPSAEVRGAFSKLIVFIAHFSLQDGPCPSPIASPGPSSQVRLINLGFPLSWEIRECLKFGAHSTRFLYILLFVLLSQSCDNLSLSEHLFRAVLNLLRREVSEHGRHLQQYFNLFVMYANLGKDSSPPLRPAFSYGLACYSAVLSHSISFS